MAEISSHQKRELVERVSRLSKQECIQLYRIFQSNGVKFTENNNGVFINLAAVSNHVLLETFEFIELCIEDQVRNDRRDAKLREFEEEFDRYSREHPVLENPKLEPDMLATINKDKSLNSLERSIMKENLNYLLTDKSDQSVRKSQAPKYSGAKAQRLIRSCRTISRSQAPATSSNADEAPSGSSLKRLRKPARTVAPPADTELVDLARGDLEDDDEELAPVIPLAGDEEDEDEDEDEEDEEDDADLDEDDAAEVI